MNSEKFVYVTYIAATPEKVWQALIDGDLTRQYWGNENVSDWQKGSRWQHVSADGKGAVRVTGEVIEAIPNKRLALSWAEPADAADRKKHTRVVIEIEPVEDLGVRLTVTHDEFQPGSNMRERIEDGWPRVLASLKSFLETGRPLNTWARRSSPRA